MRAAGIGQLKDLAKAALIIGVALTGIAAAREAINPEGHSSPYVGPYDGSTEDLALQAYEKRHPECLLWSDWRKLCSHAGPGGATSCRTDPNHAVSPSQPFCGVSTDGDPAHREQGEREAIERFAIRPVNPPDTPDFIADRPFNGRTIDEMSHPSCRIWGDGRSPICAEDGVGAPACSNAAVRKIVREQPFVCMEWKPVDACKPRKLPILRRPSNAAPLIPEYVFEMVKSAPVWGLYCKR